MTQYWGEVVGGGGGTRHFFLLTLYNSKNIGGHVPPPPGPPAPRSLPYNKKVAPFDRVVLNSHSHRL